MYVPKAMEISEEACVAFVREYPFATVTSGPPLQATHIPLQLAPDNTHLTGHLAKANPHWRDLDGAETLIVFNGPHAYISGSDYETTPAVPTWNYAAVHINARCKVIEMGQNSEVTEALLAEYEPQWQHQTEIYQRQYLDKLSKAIVALSFDIVTVTGKFKLGQQKSTSDQSRVFSRLSDSDALSDQALAQFMSRWEIVTGQD